MKGIIHSVVEDSQLRKLIEQERSHNRELALTGLMQMRDAFPETTLAIETKTAVRSM